MPSISNADRKDARPGRNGLYWLAIALIFALGIGFRLYRINVAHLDINPDRQLHGAVVARGIYYQNFAPGPDWKRAIAIQQWRREPVIEPTVLEHLTALSYAAIGKETPWIACLYSALFWVVGGFFLFLLADELAGRAGAAAALVFYLLSPYAVLASRTFQPDALMVALICASFYVMLRWHKNPTWKWTVIAGLVTGAAVFIKTVDVSILGFAWAALILSTLGLRRALRDRQVWLILALSLLPAAAYFGIGKALNIFGSQLDYRFFPQLWIRPEFYLGWLAMIQQSLRVEMLLLGLVGLFLIRPAIPRRMLAGAWVGYLALCFGLSYHVENIPYYQLPVYPVVALGIAAVIQLIWDHLPQVRAVRPLLASALILLTGLASFMNFQSTISAQDYLTEISRWQMIGSLVPRGAPVADLADEYGRKLTFYGWVDSVHWANTADLQLKALAGTNFDVKQAFEQRIAGRDYFIVTMLDELKTQRVLASLLKDNYAVYKHGEGYIIYDLRNPPE